MPYSYPTDGANGDPLDPNFYAVESLGGGVATYQNGEINIAGGGAINSGIRWLFQDGAGRGLLLPNTRIAFTVRHITVPNTTSSAIECNLSMDAWEGGVLWNDYGWPTNGFQIFGGMRFSNGAYQLGRFNNGGATVIDGPVAMGEVNNGEIWHYIFERDASNNVRSKRWLDPNTEPGAWTLEAVDAAHPSGLVGFALTGRNSVTRVYDITITNLDDPDATFDEVLGITSIGGSNTSSTRIWGQVHTTPAGAYEVTKVSAYTRSASSTVSARVAIYEDDGGVPGNLLAESINAQTLNVTPDWRDWQFPENTVLQGDTPYWLCLWGASAIWHYQDDNPGADRFSEDGAAFPNWPAYIGAPTTSANQDLSIYASMRAIAAGPIIDNVNITDQVRDASVNNQINGSGLAGMSAAYLVDPNGNELLAQNLRPADAQTLFDVDINTMIAGNLKFGTASQLRAEFGAGAFSPLAFGAGFDIGDETQ